MATIFSPAVCGRISPCCGFIPSTRQGSSSSLPNKQWDWCIGWQQSQSLCRKKTVPVLIIHTGKLDASSFLQGNAMPDTNKHRLLSPSACAIYIYIYSAYDQIQKTAAEPWPSPRTRKYLTSNIPRFIIKLRQILISLLTSSVSSSFQYVQGMTDLCNKVFCWVNIVSTQEGIAMLPYPHWATRTWLLSREVKKQMEKPRKNPGSNPQN